MEVRITYRSEIYIEGESLSEIKRKFNGLNLDPISKDEEGVNDFSFIELASVEDANSYKDLKSEFEALI